MSADDFTINVSPVATPTRDLSIPGIAAFLFAAFSDDLMRHPDVFDVDGEPCLLVIKIANTTISRANGVFKGKYSQTMEEFSIVREYFPNDLTVNQTSMEWGIIDYDSKSEVFSEPGDSGSIIVDICGRISGMLTSGGGKTKGSHMTYATPFWWLLERNKIHFPNVVVDWVSRHRQDRQR